MKRLSKNLIKHSQRGLMLVEVLVCVAIMALMAAVVAFAIIPIWVEHQKKIARQGADSMRLLVGAWRMNHIGEDCPDFARLRAEKTADRSSNGRDPWGSAFVIRCEEDDITVISPGPDRRLGTEDDIIAPPQTIATD